MNICEKDLRVPDTSGHNSYTLSVSECDKVMELFQGRAAEGRAVCQHCFKSDFSVDPEILGMDMWATNRNRVEKFKAFLAIRCGSCHRCELYCFARFGLRFLTDEEIAKR